MRGVINKTSGVYMILLLMLGAGISFYKLPTAGGDPEVQLSLDSKLLSGAVTASLEDWYGRELPFRDQAIDLWGSVGYLLFHEGREGVLVGEQDWLFTTEEFEATGADEANLSANLARMAEVGRFLERRGIDLIVALLPAKARIYRDRLGRYQLPDWANWRYGHALDALRRAGIRTPNLHEVLSDARRRGAVFLRTDTHWSELGVQAVAGAVARAAAASAFPRRRFVMQRGPAEPHRGDLMNFIRLGKWLDAKGPRPDLLVSLQARPAGEPDLLFGDATIPVVLVGTSYSADPRWGFEAALKVELGADVLNVAHKARGPMVPMREYLASERFRETPPALIIWEVPERYLTRSPSSPAPGPTPGIGPVIAESD